MNEARIRQFETPQALAEKAAALWLEALSARAPQTAACLAALSGGRIARSFFTALAAQVLSGKGSLDGVEFFWADERCVPPTDPASNFLLADEALFQPLGIPLDRIHRIRGEIPPDAAASQMEQELLQRAPSSPDGQPVLDFVFLGMGEDGHIASLFPNEREELARSKRAYRPVNGPKPPPLRVTLNYGPLIAAQNVWVLASGPGKRDALDRSLAGTQDTPLGRLLSKREMEGVEIFTDIAR
jgi:6-phosphogluconolactonase